MTATQNGIATFISSLRIHFPTRHEGEAREIEWIKSVRNAIYHYDDSILSRASQKIIDTRTDRRFPLPSEIRKICGDIAADDRRSKLSVDGDKFKSSDPWSPHRVRLADELMHTSMGREAARGGWILSLHDYVRKFGELPRDDYTKRKLIHGAKDFDDGYRMAIDGGFPGARAMVQLGDKMLARREELTKAVLGDAA